MSWVYFTRLQFIQLISHPSCLSPGWISSLEFPFAIVNSWYLSLVTCGLILSGNFWGSKIRHGILGANLWWGDWLRSLDALGIFLGFDFCPHSIIPITWNPEFPPAKQVFQAVPCSWFLGEAEMTSYEDKHTPDKCTLNIIMGSTFRLAAIQVLSGGGNGWP